MNKENKKHKEHLDKLTDEYLELLEANAAPLQIAAIILHIFHHLAKSKNRMEAMIEYIDWGVNNGAFDLLYKSFSQEQNQPGYAERAVYDYSKFVRKTIQEDFLQKLVPGVEFEVHLHCFEEPPYPARLHFFKVRIKDFLAEGSHEEYVLNAEAGTYNISAEHFQSLNEMLALFFNHPAYFNLQEEPYLDDFDGDLLPAVEKQVQGILQILYQLDREHDEEISHSAVAGLLEVAYALQRGYAMSHEPPMQRFQDLKNYLQNKALGNVHQTLSEHLQQAAHSHPEHYRIALNRMVREVFRRHFLIDMNEQFQVTVMMPDEQGRYKVKVDAPVMAQLKEAYPVTDQHLDALTWMLESIFNYAEELELPNNVWRGKETE